ncbi:hypothetical protein ACFFWC_24130 [Plantactinospora siamensis]|uniref:FG-GAP repeat protein n=1 Tax=Plantactinospora siamensis TaxID=555372 RepID=A0ABV6P592_9ACTN
MSILAVTAGLALSVPARAASEVRTITRDGVTLMYERVTKPTTPRHGTGATRSDFDGDGIDDIAATGQPMSYDLPGNPTGVLAVRYSSAPQVDYFLGVLPPTDGGCGCFGDGQATGDFNGDGYDDLAIGDSDERDPRNGANAGGLWVIPGSAAGLVVDSAQHFNQSSSGVPGDSEQDDKFGGTLAAGDLNGDGRDDLAVGAWNEAIGSTVSAGTVTVLFGSASGLTGANAQYLHQNQAAVPGAAERNDNFGMSLAIGKVNKDRYADLVIGAPHENDGQSWNGSGMVTLMWGSAGGVSSTGATAVTGGEILWATGSPNTVAWYLGSSLAVGDVNGDGYGDVIVGAPQAQGPDINSGLVAVFTGRSGGLYNRAVRVITQATAGVPGAPEGGDLFGGALAAGDVTGDGKADVLVGVPGEALGSTTESGMITLLKGSAGGLIGTGSQGFDESNSVIPGAPERGDRFGASVAVLNYNGTGPLDAVVAAPGEEVPGDQAGYPSGLMTPLLGSSGGLVPQSAQWTGATLRTDHLWPKSYGTRIAGPQSSYGY